MRELKDTLKRSQWRAYVIQSIAPTLKGMIQLSERTEFEAMKEIRLSAKLDTLEYEELILEQL